MRIGRLLSNRHPLIYGGVEKARAFSYTEESTEAIANASLFEEARNQIINVGSPETVTINDTCSTALRIKTSERPPEHVASRPQELPVGYSTTEKSEGLLDHRNTHALDGGVFEMILWAKEIGAQELTFKIPLEITTSAPEVWFKNTM